MPKFKDPFDQSCFWALIEAPQGLPVGNQSQTRRPRRARRSRADRKARPQWPMPLQLAEAVSRNVAWKVAAFDGAERKHYWREDW